MRVVICFLVCFDNETTNDINKRSVSLMYAYIEKTLSLVDQLSFVKRFFVFYSLTLVLTVPITVTLFIFNMPIILCAAFFLITGVINGVVTLKYCIDITRLHRLKLLLLGVDINATRI